MAAHSSILSWEIPWIEHPGGLQSMRLQTVGHDWAAHTHQGLTVAILLIVFWLSRSSFLPLVSYCLILKLMISDMVYFDCLLFVSCVSIIGFCLVSVRLTWNTLQVWQSIFQLMTAPLWLRAEPALSPPPPFRVFHVTVCILLYCVSVKKLLYDRRCNTFDL